MTDEEIEKLIEWHEAEASRLADRNIPNVNLDKHQRSATALRQLMQERQWRPIDEEAKNGEPWLLYRDGEQFVGKWYKNSREWGISAPVGDGEVRTYQSIGPRSFSGVIFFDGPSHFAPLPQPPSSFEEPKATRTDQPAEEEA